MYKKILVILLFIFLTDCSTLVAKYISSQETYHLTGISSSYEDDYKTEKFCSNTEKSCMSYLIAGPVLRYTVIKGTKFKNEYKFSDGFGNDDFIQLELESKDVATFRGEVVLIHGFLYNKESMIPMAEYFRYHGFKVLIPDLLGHGKSSGDKGYGVKDSLILDQLLSSREDNGLPKLIIGYSLGAITAVALAEHRQDVYALLLKAPMVRFDEATINFSKSYPNIISTFFSEETIREGAIKALVQAKVSLAQTDILPSISQIKIPTLIMASSNDRISPFSYFEPYHSQNATLVDLDNRSHIGMGVISDQENVYIKKWLNSKTNKIFQRLNIEEPLTFSAMQTVTK